MNAGHFIVEQLSEGVFDINEQGAIVKVSAPNKKKKPLTETELYARRNFAQIALDPVLITNGKYHILLDSGLGIGLDSKEKSDRISNIHTNLEIFGVRPDDIDYVILSHLHYDHAAGLSYTDGDHKTHASLPNAKIVVQKSEWDYALSLVDQKNPIPGMGYELDELYRLHADGRFQFIEDEFHTLINGIDLIRTGGHTPGHQIVRIHNRGETVYFGGDLVPNEFQLNQYGLNKVDVDPAKARKMKILILKQAWEEQAQLLFYHSVQVKNGRLVKDANRKYALHKAGS